MNNLSRWDPFRGISTLQEQMSRMFEDTLRGRSDQSALTTWAPAVDIYGRRPGGEGGLVGAQIGRAHV